MIDRLLANVLGDAFAHHEHAQGEGPERSLVLCDDGAETGAWVGAFLDWQRAGEVAAAVLERSGETADGRPLFAIPARLYPPPEQRGEPVDVPGKASAGSLPPSSNLVGRIMGLAKEIFGVQAERHNFLLREIHRARPRIKPSTLGDLQRLDERELLIVLERLEGERRRRELFALDPGVHPAHHPVVSADEAFVKLRDHFGAGS